MLCSHYDLRGAVFSAKKQGKESSPFPKSIFFRLLEAVAHILKCSFSSEKHTVKTALRGSMFIVFLCFPAKCAQFYKLKCFTSLPALKIQPLKRSQILSSICTITNSTRLKVKLYPRSHNRNPCSRVIPPDLQRRHEHLQLNWADKSGWNRAADGKQHHQNVLWVCWQGWCHRSSCSRQSPQFLVKNNAKRTLQQKISYSLEQVLQQTLI